jgi:hypothetical protein
MALRQSHKAITERSKRKLQKIKELLIKSKQEVLKYYGNELIRGHFEYGNRTQFPEWPRLTTQYARWKIDHFGVQPMLVATGDLKRSVVGKFKLRTDYQKAIVILTFDKATDYGVYVETLRPWSQPSAQDNIKLEARMKLTFETYLKNNKISTRGVSRF